MKIWTVLLVYQSGLPNKLRFRKAKIVNFIKQIHQQIESKSLISMKISAEQKTMNYR